MAFRKHISFLLAIFLLVSNLGLAFNVHYCKGQIASVSTVYNLDEPCTMQTSHNNKDGCALEFENDHKSCCADILFASDVDDVVVKFISFDFDQLLIDQQNNLIFFDNSIFTKRNTFGLYCFEANGPPLFKLYSQYILYA